MSYQIAIPTSRKAAARFVGKVRRRLQQALVDNPEVSRSQIANAIGVHRSVITRQLNGKADMSLSRVAEIAWAAGYRPKFDLERIERQDGCNRVQEAIPARDFHFSAKAMDANNNVQIEVASQRKLVEAS